MTANHCVIFFAPKFCQSQIDSYLTPKKHGRKSLPNNISYWELSFHAETTEVVFDLTVVEWVSSEAIAFLFAWIRNVKNAGKSVRVILPFRQELSAKHSQKEILDIEKKSSGMSGSYSDNVERQKRRKRCSAFLMAVYGLYDQVGVSEDNFENMADYSVYNVEARTLRENTHQIISFTPFSLVPFNNHVKFDTHFQELINENLDTKFRTGGIFRLQKDVQSLLKDYACYTPFESKILSNIITQELYINSLQHSFSELESNNLLECYITAFLSNKWKYSESEKFVPSFKEEKLQESLDFYKDKKKIRATIEKTLQDPKYGDVKVREADLKSFDDFNNTSYLEYTFLDFGIGIHESLKDQFGNFSSSDAKNHSELSSGFSKAHSHSKILEYAFLMDTSRNPLDVTIEYYDLVPRGLFFLVDMVRRYKGLLTVRSGFGKIIYDFSDRVVIAKDAGKTSVKMRGTYRIKDAIKHTKENDAYFPGTMFTIVLPEKATDFQLPKKKDADVIASVRSEHDLLSTYAYGLTEAQFSDEEYPLEHFSPTSFEYLSILFVYNSIIESLKHTSGEIYVKDIYNRLFLEINKLLDLKRTDSSIIFFDFSGLKTGNASWIKILYYLVLTPKINEHTKAVIINLPEDEDKIIESLMQNYITLNTAGTSVRHKMPEPFLYKPIPCIQFNAEKDNLIKWIGLKSVQDGPLLTSLLLGSEMKKSYSRDAFDYPENIGSNMFVRFQEHIYPTFSGLEALKDKFYSQQKAAISGFLKDRIENGKDENGIERRIYLSSNGGYQFEYLSLYELLHDKYVARYFGKCLLDKYCDYVRQNILEGKDLEDYRFSKILAVTVSSQLLGVAIRDLIEEESSYHFLLRNDQESEKRITPELIMLSSYFSFATEKPFEKIGRDDNILIVNDVISTGALVKKIYDKLDRVKQVPIAGVFSIVDSRIPKEFIIDPDKEMPSEKFEDSLGKMIFSLADFASGIVLRKYPGPYDGKGDPERKRINPLLNALVELKSIHSQQKKIIFPDASELINDKELDDSFFMIGHFQQNMTHNGYLTDMRSLYTSGKGIYLIKRLKTQIERELNIEMDAAGLDNLEVQLVDLEDKLSSLETFEPNLAKSVTKICTELKQLKNSLGKRHLDRNIEQKFNPDFIFYPIFSGIEKVGHHQLSSIFNTHPDNIVGLQRFDTPKGWRFPFPAKRFNEITRGKSILIIDSGSLTGESLIQLIDNIGFLDIKKIVVISIITRVEDFYREFYSRLRSLKVKRLRLYKEKEQDVNSGFEPESRIVPLEVLFGINLHIPVYSSFSTCPFCAEINYLNNINVSNYQVNPKSEVQKYIDKRMKMLRLVQVSGEELINAPYLPVLRDSLKVDAKGLFSTRDLLGKIDSYRFYPEYFTEVEMLFQSFHPNIDWSKISASEQKTVEQFLTCCLHERALIDLIASMLNEVSSYLCSYLKYLVQEDSNFSTYYLWKKSMITELFFYFNNDEFFSIEWLTQLIRYSDEEASEFIQFKVWDILYRTKNISSHRPKLKTVLDKLAIKPSSPDTPFNLTKKLLDLNTHASKTEPITRNDFKIAFSNLKEFYLLGKSSGRHFDLIAELNKLIELVTSTTPSYDAVSNTLYKIVRIFEEDVIPSVSIITSDPNLTKYYRTLEGKLNDITGIASAAKKLVHFRNELQEQSAYERISELACIFAELADFASHLVVDVLSEDSDQSYFLNICAQYPCHLLELLESLAQQNSFIKITDKEKIKEESPAVEIHEVFLREILHEVVRNAKRAYLEDMSADKGDLKLWVDVKVRSEKQVILKIEQNYAFQKPKEPREGGLTEHIQYYIEKFNGVYEDNRDDSLQNKLNFIITITLKLYATI